MAEDYQKWAMEVADLLDDNTGWKSQYADYAKDILASLKKIQEARKLFHVFKPLSVYVTIGNAKKGKCIFDLRYLGQSVGEITVEGNKVLLTSKEQPIKGTDDYYFGYLPEQHIKNKEWNGSAGAAFREFYKTRYETEDLPRQKEHMYEEALFTEFEKTRRAEKSLPGIQPIKISNIRFHMKTALKASNSKNNKIEISQDYVGGDIDIFCRRNKKLAVIEVKDEYKKEESFELAIKQAISYAVFIQRLVRSGRGADWMKIWGMENQYKDNLVIYAIACMPYDDSIQIPEYIGKRIQIDDDMIELGAIGIQNKGKDSKVLKGVNCIWL